jgi:hypothetical protein
MLGNRFTIVQHHLDNIEMGWHIGQLQTDADPDVLILKNADAKKVAYAFLPQNWFDGGGMQQYIEWEIRRALNDTKAK